MGPVNTASQGGRPCGHRRWMIDAASRRLLGLAAQHVPERVHRLHRGRAAAARVKSGCSTRSGIEVCFTSPPTVPADPTVLGRASTLFDAAGAGDTIRVAMFRWDIKPPTDALLAAQRRGAVVHLVGDDDLRLNRHGRRLITGLEDQDPDRTNVTICDGACLPWRAPGPYPGQPGRAAPQVLPDGDRRRAVLHHVARPTSRTGSTGSTTRCSRSTTPASTPSASTTSRGSQAQSTKVDGKRWDDRSKVCRTARPPPLSTPTAATCCWPR